MTLLRTGIDLIEIERVERAIQRHGERFLQRVFTPTELVEAGNNPASLAARFAAKEAAAKALGTGIGPVSWLEIEVLRACNQPPMLRLSGAAAQRAAELGLTEWALSLSHTCAFAVASVVAIG
jgi:holo-[acyl-carrier protein] synthase